MSDELTCPVCDEVAWRGTFPVLEGVRAKCPAADCGADLVVQVEVCDFYEDEGWDGIASLREAHEPPPRQP